MSRIIKRGTHGKWGTAVRATAGKWAHGFLAWGCLGETGGNGPLQEKNKVWFQFGATASEALEKLHAELDSLPS